MAHFVKMKALKSSSEKESFRGKKKIKHIKRPYLASSQGVLALALIGSHRPVCPFQIFGSLDFWLLSAWTEVEPRGLCSHSSISFHGAFPGARATHVSAG